MKEVDLERASWFASTNFYGMEIQDQHKLIDYADSLKVALENLRKEYEVVNGMLADLQNHSNLYHKGVHDGAESAIYPERERCAKLVADARWQLLVKGGLGALETPRLHQLEQDIKNGVQPKKS